MIKVEGILRWRVFTEEVRSSLGCGDGVKVFSGVNRVVSKGSSSTAPALDVYVVKPHSINGAAMLASVFRRSRSRVYRNSSVCLGTLSDGAGVLGSCRAVLISTITGGGTSGLPTSGAVSRFRFKLKLTNHSRSIGLAIESFPKRCLASAVGDSQRSVCGFVTGTAIVLVTISAPCLVRRKKQCGTRGGGISVIARCLGSCIATIGSGLMLFIPLGYRECLRRKGLPLISRGIGSACGRLASFFKRGGVTDFIAPVVALNNVRFSSVGGDGMPNSISGMSMFHS